MGLETVFTFEHFATRFAWICFFLDSVTMSICHMLFEFLLRSTEVTTFITLLWKCCMVVDDMILQRIRKCEPLPTVVTSKTFVVILLHVCLIHPEGSVGHVTDGALHDGAVLHLLKPEPGLFLPVMADHALGQKVGLRVPRQGTVHREHGLALVTLVLAIRHGRGVGVPSRLGVFPPRGFLELLAVRVGDVEELVLLTRLLERKLPGTIGAAVLLILSLGALRFSPPCFLRKLL